MGRSLRWRMRISDKRSREGRTQNKSTQGGKATATQNTGKIGNVNKGGMGRMHEKEGN